MTEATTAATPAAEARAARLRLNGHGDPPSDSAPWNTPSASSTTPSEMSDLRQQIADLATTVERLHETVVPMGEALERVHSMTRSSAKAHSEDLAALREMLSENSPERQPADRRGPARTVPTSATATEVTEAREVIAELRAVEARTAATLRTSHVLRAAAAAVPFVAALAIVMVFLVPLSEILGVGPVTRWIWIEFATTESTATRVLIFITMLAVTGLVLWAVYRLGHVLTRRYRRLIEEEEL